MSSTMAWEERNNQRYYYQKKRKGKKVFSIYIGNDLYAHVVDFQAQIKREKTEAANAQFKKEKTSHLQLDKELNQIATLVTCLTHSAFLINGFHTHKGQWRCTK